MIRAVYRDGAIHPLDQLPADWHDGQELVVQELPGEDFDSDSDRWLQELNAAAAQIPDRVHDEVALALERAEAEAKEFVRREMGQSS